MKKLIPFYITTIAPYLLIAVCLGIFSQSFVFSENDITNQNIFWGVIAFVFFFYFITMIISTITLIISLVKKWDSDKLLFANMIVKLIQIPAYIVIFILGICMLVTIFTYAISIIFWLLDCVSVFSTGLIGMAGAIRGKSEGKFKTGFTVTTSILSYIFCIDVIVAVVMYVKNKKAQKKLAEESFNNDNVQMKQV